MLLIILADSDITVYRNNGASSLWPDFTRKAHPQWYWLQWPNLKITWLSVPVKRPTANNKGLFVHFHLAIPCLSGIAHTFPSPVKKDLITAAKRSQHVSVKMCCREWVQAKRAYDVFISLMQMQALPQFCQQEKNIKAAFWCNTEILKDTPSLWNRWCKYVFIFVYQCCRAQLKVSFH